MNNVKIAAALRLLAEAFETPAESPPAQPADAKPAAPARRGRGRPVEGEAAAPAAPAQSAAVVADDPFAATAPAAPVASIEDVRKALTSLSEATSQAKAIEVLKKSGGADNLATLASAAYGQVVAAVNVELRIAYEAKVAPAVVDDPFALPTSAPAAAEKPVTIDEVKAVVVETQKRTSTDSVQKVVMQHGGKAKNPDTGIEGPSLKHLPAEQFAATIAALKALPATK